jgi:two-component system alkaline phosphatase synthesis response regulator PhoP
METSGAKVLLIEPSKERNTILTSILIELNFRIISVRNVETAVKKWLEHSPQIIICQKDLREHSGFHLYSMLKTDLLKIGIPFVLLMNQFNKEDLLVGMELGIDSFIFPPYDQEKISNILHKQLQKSKERNQVAGNQFKSIFEVTPFGVFIARDAKIIEANKSFYKLIGETFDKTNPYIITNIFDFHTDKSNELKLLRCLNGISRYAYFKCISLKAEPSVEFDIYLSFTENGMPSTKIMGLVIPVSEKKKDSNLSEKVKPQKNRSALNEALHSLTYVNENDDFFTAREKQVLRLSAKGEPVKRIADHLGISARTVEKHRSNIIRKTKSGNIIEAVFYASKKHIIELG